MELVQPTIDERDRQQAAVLLEEFGEAFQYIRGFAAGYPVSETDYERFLKIEELADHCLRKLRALT